MKEIKYLEKTGIDVKGIVGLSKNVNQKLLLDEKFPEVLAKTKYDTDHFFIEISGKQIPCSKSSKTEIRKIIAGIFKGSYVLIERRDGIREKTNVYLLHQDGFLPLAETAKLLDDDEVSGMLEKEYVAKLTAFKLNTFDLGQDNQAYKYFCEKLPKKLFAIAREEIVDENTLPAFAKRVIKYFYGFKDVNLIPNKNNRFVRTNLCKAEAYEFFDKFAKYSMQIEEEKEMEE